MNKEEFTKAMTFLGIAYNKEFTSEQVSVWYEFFKDTNYEVFKNGIKRIVPKKQFMPSIAELKHEITMINNPIMQLNADEEWDEVLKAVRKYGSYQQEEAMNSLNPYTRSIVRHVGFHRICMSENIQWERKEFIELFNINQDRDETALMLSEPQMTLAEIIRMAALKSIDNEDKLLLEGGRIK